MELPLLKDFVTIFGLSIAVLLVCHLVRVPSIVGFLITGVLCGPYGLGLVSESEEVRALAEVGIIVLLFSVGMEFSISKILKYRRYFLIAGPLQVIFTTLIGCLIGFLLGREIGESIFLGFLLSLSSTAIVMRVLQERAETGTEHGRLILGILIFQDIIVVPMMLLTPMLAGEGAEIDGTALFLIAKGFLILALTFISAIQIVPTLLFYVAKTRSRELFLLTILVICFSVAWVTSSIGLSLALGAFLAGLTISESDYSHSAIGEVIPFQDVFTSFFFVSIGMLLDIGFVISNPILIITISLGVVLMKSLVTGSISVYTGVPLKYAVIGALTLAQVGEFSFVLATSGIVHGIGTDYLHQLFLSVAVITMGITPLLISYAPRLANYLVSLPFFQSAKTELSGAEDSVHETKKKHVIIIGFGFSGRNLARSSQKRKFLIQLLT